MNAYANYFQIGLRDLALRGVIVAKHPAIPTGPEPKP